MPTSISFQFRKKKQMRNIDALNAPYNFFENAFITVLDCLLN